MIRLLAVAGVLGVATVGAVVLRDSIREEPFVIVHWSNSHPMRDGLLPDMAEKFNDADHETAAGQPIEVVVLSCDSAKQVDDLASRISDNVAAEDACRKGLGLAPDPTIITPQSADWLIDLEQETGREVVDREAAPSIAETWLGIVTYREMAECLGWPDVRLGYADIIELGASDDGWNAYGESADLDWGQEPLVAFTNPSTSTSGRNVLVSLYAMAAGKSPAELTADDIDDPAVVAKVKAFQDLVDHYMPGTIPLNTKVAQGPQYGQFFLMPEDNLWSLCRGTEKAIATDGTTQTLQPVSGLVMVYPEEGSVVNSNPAAIVDAPWVTAEHRQAADEWIDFLMEDQQQERFAEAGFRPTPASDVQIDEQAFAECGLSAEPPSEVIEPGDLQPEVLSQIIDSWGAVKNPAIVTFVVDVSGSMKGEPLEQVKLGLVRLLEEMDDADIDGNDSLVGLVAFSDHVVLEVPPQPLGDAGFEIAGVVNSLEATGGTALFDAVARGVELSDEAVGDPNATRAVVVLSDGEATKGKCLHEVISMTVDEVTDVPLCLVNATAESELSEDTSIEDVVGGELVVPHEHDVQVFFVGFGESDINVGRLLAQATGAEYQGSAEDDLAAVIEELSGYF